MSTIFFGLEELANVAAYLSEGGGAYVYEEDAHAIARDLAAYSVGNGAAYRFRYQTLPVDEVRGSRGHKAEDILAVANDLRIRGAIRPRAARTCLSLLRYNGPEGEGLKRFRGSKAYGVAVASLLGRAYTQLLRETEAKADTRPAAEPKPLYGRN